MDTFSTHDLVILTLNGPTVAALLVETGLYDEEVTKGEITALLGTAIHAVASRSRISRQ